MRKPKLEPIEEDDHLIPWDQFVECVKEGDFIDYDGYGYLATATQTSERTIKPSSVATFKKPEWVTHVNWCNR